MYQIEFLKDLTRDIGLEIMNFYSLRGKTEIVGVREEVSLITNKAEVSIAWHATAIILNTGYLR